MVSELGFGAFWVSIIPTAVSRLVSHQAFLCTRSCHKIRIEKNYVTQVVVALFTLLEPACGEKKNIEGRKLSSIPQPKNGCASIENFPVLKE